MPPPGPGAATLPANRHAVRTQPAGVITARANPPERVFKIVTDHLLVAAQECRIVPVIPPKRNRKTGREYDAASCLAICRIPALALWAKMIQRDGRHTLQSHLMPTGVFITPGRGQESAGSGAGRLLL